MNVPFQEDHLHSRFWSAKSWNQGFKWECTGFMLNSHFQRFDASRFHIESFQETSNAHWQMLWLITDVIFVVQMLFLVTATAMNLFQRHHSREFKIFKDKSSKYKIFYEMQVSFASIITAWINNKNIKILVTPRIRKGPSLAMSVLTGPTKNSFSAPETFIMMLFLAVRRHRLFLTPPQETYRGR